MRIFAISVNRYSLTMNKLVDKENYDKYICFFQFRISIYIEFA